MSVERFKTELDVIMGGCPEVTAAEFIAVMSDKIATLNSQIGAAIGGAVANGEAASGDIIKSVEIALENAGHWLVTTFDDVVHTVHADLMGEAFKGSEPDDVVGQSYPFVDAVDVPVATMVKADPAPEPQPAADASAAKAADPAPAPASDGEAKPAENQ